MRSPQHTDHDTRHCTPWVLPCARVGPHLMHLPVHGRYPWPLDLCTCLSRWPRAGRVIDLTGKSGGKWAHKAQRSFFLLGTSWLLGSRRAPLLLGPHEQLCSLCPVQGAIMDLLSGAPTQSDSRSRVTARGRVTVRSGRPLLFSLQCHGGWASPWWLGLHP